MSDDSGARFVEHAARASALGELHARPAPSLAAGARLLRYVFAFEPDYAGRDDALVSQLCVQAGVAPPQPGVRVLQIAVGGLDLRWERHTEFVTYTFVAPARADDAFAAAAARLRAAQPGPLAAAIRLSIAEEESGAAPRRFACASRIAEGRAVLETSFVADLDGVVDWALACRGLSPGEIGALAQSALEIETYRTTALLALPLARRVAGAVRDMEAHLGGLARRLSAPEADGAESLYGELSALSERVETEIAGAAWRFAAAQAYGAIVGDRLAALGERPADDRPTVGGFLSTRLTPALRTCASMSHALRELADRVARAADLIRTRIDLQLAQQNNELLTALNRRTRQQMRLQQTVEGLSVAAVSYYVLGLIAYALKGAKDGGVLPVDAGVATALALPLVLAAVWFAVRRIRSSHAPE